VVDLEQSWIHTLPLTRPIAAWSLSVDVRPGLLPGDPSGGRGVVRHRHPGHPLPPLPRILTHRLPHRPQTILEHLRRTQPGRNGGYTFLDNCLDDLLAFSSKLSTFCIFIWHTYWILKHFFASLNFVLNSIAMFHVSRIAAFFSGFFIADFKNIQLK